ncbi:hypothetical protein E6H36_02730 [Candidatus Bathyarchaeota archaeon]|nr:MAG: hypothetical protein E6H36_02730 [Candidatus Bathyarchaeota archaeon]TMI30989.1 MAG: hypothetical protein E6H29_06170 [Candidatus Bathyarchaeota archaeon]
MAETQTRLIGLDEASRQPYSTILSYPSGNPETVLSRISQMKSLNVEGLDFNGHLKIGRVAVLGKGVAGIVIVGVTDGRRVALKVRREDSRRDSLVKEGEMLRMANQVEVGPKFAGATRDVLAMELIDGDTLPRWLEHTTGRGQRSRVRTTFLDMLRQCSRLDSAGIDHGELSRAHKNILVTGSGKPCILDFESAGLSRRASNLTSLVQYLFFGGGFARNVARILGPIEKENLLIDLRFYKTSDKTKGFEKVVGTLGLGGKRRVRKESRTN